MMVDRKNLIYLFDSGKILKALLAILALSLIPLLEIYLTMFLLDFVSINIIMVILAGNSMLGLLLTYSNFTQVLKNVKIACKKGIYKDENIQLLTGTFCLGLFLILPGFATSGFAILVLMLRQTRRLGSFFLAIQDISTKELYETINLYDL